MICKPINLTFGKRIVRAIVMNGVPMFSSTDLCDVLGYVNPHKILSRCCDSSPEYVRVMTAGGPQSLRMIGRNDIENLLLNYSRKPEAKTLWRWFENEVFPEFERNIPVLTTALFLLSVFAQLTDDLVILIPEELNLKE